MEWDALHNVLQNLMAEMLPLGAKLTGVGRGLGGIGAMLYVGSRIWRQLANNEPIDFYPLFRPFVIAFFLTIYPSFINAINGILQPTVTGTRAILSYENQDIQKYNELKSDALMKVARQEGKLYLIDDEEYDKKLDELGVFDKELYTTVLEKVQFDMKQSFNGILNNILDFLYQAVSLVIDAIRTFFLIVLIIIGPLSLGISIWDGFKDTLQFWAARYIQVFMWLPVANVFGAICSKIQVLMLKNAIDELNSGAVTIDTFSGADTSYMIFLLIGIVGYLTVPTVASYIVQSCGIGGGLRMYNNAFSNSTNAAGAIGGALAGAGGRGAVNVAGAQAYIAQGIGSIAAGGGTGTKSRYKS